MAYTVPPPCLASSHCYLFGWLYLLTQVSIYMSPVQIQHIQAPSPKEDTFTNYALLYHLFSSLKYFQQFVLYGLIYYIAADLSLPTNSNTAMGKDMPIFFAITPLGASLLPYTWWALNKWLRELIMIH